MANNTIFDDVFQTIKEKMPELTIPLINEAFGTAYSSDTLVILGENEHHTVNGKLITDSHLIIGHNRYHLECQSTEDGSMVLRMIEYDFTIGLEYAEKINRKYRIHFPKSCVLYLRGNSPEKFLDLELIFSEEHSIEYKVPVLRMNWYSLKELFHKQLVMLLPFYIIRYKTLKEQLEKDDTLKQKLFSEFETIENYLEELFLQNGKERDFRDLIEIISKLANYIFSESENIRKGLGEIMGGKVLELETDRLIKQGKEIGLEQGEDALSDLMKKLLDENRMDDLRKVTVDKAYRKKLLQEMQNNPKQTA